MSRRTTRTPATEAEALAALLGLWNRYGMRGFNPNLRGPGAGAVMLATRRGWLWNSGQATFLTLAGVQALGEFLGHDLVAEQAEVDARECAETAASISAHRGRVMEAAE